MPLGRHRERGQACGIARRMNREAYSDGAESLGAEF